VVRVH